jgi:hypothetical protein
MLNYEHQKVSILNTQIQEARQEIRQWQNYIFNTAYWIHTIIMEFASFA